MGKKYNKDWGKILETILDLCREKDRGIGVNELKKLGLISDSKSINNYLKENTKYSTYQNFCRDKGYKFEGDLLVNGKYKPTNELKLEDHISLVKDFYKKNKRFPRRPRDFTTKNNLPSDCAFFRFLKINNIKSTEFAKMVGDNKINPNDFSYEYWLNKLKIECKKLGEPMKQNEITSYSLPSSKWFIENCNNPNVTNYNQFIEYELNMNPRFNMSKERITKLILELQKKMSRPIQKKDLKLCGICESTVSKIWGSFNEMKESLGLEIKFKSRKAKEIDINKVKRDICRICSFVYESEGRIKISQNDWRLLEDVISYPSCSKWLKNNGSSIRDFITSIGYEYIKAGNGLNYIFNDGEKVKSQYELNFSKYLREDLKLGYKKDYQREVRYTKFISNYTGKLDYDYIININNNLIYIEIAGVLRDYKKTYKTKKIKSKSREHYRLTLLDKEKMFEDNNLNYYILFPEDIKRSKLDFMFKSYINNK